MVPANQIKDAMILAKIKTVDIGKCGVCGKPREYVRKGEEISLDGCECPTWHTGPRSWDEVSCFISDDPATRLPLFVIKKQTQA